MDFPTTGVDDAERLIEKPAPKAGVAGAASAIAPVAARIVQVALMRPPS
jgi:hypothetical protein